MNKSTNNHVLSSLSSQESKRLNNILEPVPLSLGEILTEANQEIKSLYFPTKGVISVVSTMENGSTTEVGLIGKEGMVGIFEFLGNGITNNRSIVQIQGTAMRVSTELLRVEFDQNISLQQTLLGYSLKLFNQVSQCSACNNHHSVKQRIARWLIMVDDRLDDETFRVTQKNLSQMLGIRRSGVSEIASEIQQQKIISYSRGKLKILNRKALEAIACECYQVMKS